MRTKLLVLGTLLVVTPLVVLAVAAPSFLLEWGTLGSANGEFNEPLRVAVGPAGEVYVTDRFNNRIQRFDANGNFVLAWGSPGSGNGQFNRASSVAVDGLGDVYATDEASRIQRFTSNGNFVLAWGSPGSGDGQFNFASGLAVGPTGDIYVTDFGNHRVQRFNSAGIFIAKWGSFGTGDGQFQSPSDIVVDAAGNVYVMEFRGDRVQKFDSNGNLILKWGATGSGPGQFSFPAALALDASGNVYVADRSVAQLGGCVVACERIQVFDPSGAFLLQFGSAGTGPGEFDLVNGMAFDQAGNLYAVDRFNHRVQKFGFSPEDQIEGLVDAINDLIDTATPAQADKLEDAVGGLETALDELEKTPPDREAAMGNLEGAIGDLEAAANEGVDLQQVVALMDQAAGIGRLIVDEAIAEAIDRGGDSDKIDEAEEALADGDTLRAMGQYKDAVAKYKDAVSKAEGA